MKKIKTQKCVGWYQLITERQADKENNDYFLLYDNNMKRYYNIFKNEARWKYMIYSYMTLADETEIVHSQIIKKDGQKKVIVNFERPKEKGWFCKMWITRL